MRRTAAVYTSASPSSHPVWTSTPRTLWPGAASAPRCGFLSPPPPFPAGSSATGQSGMAEKQESGARERTLGARQAEASQHTHAGTEAARGKHGSGFGDAFLCRSVGRKGREDRSRLPCLRCRQLSIWDLYLQKIASLTNVSEEVSAHSKHAVATSRGRAHVHCFFWSSCQPFVRVQDTE